MLRYTKLETNISEDRNAGLKYTRLMEALTNTIGRSASDLFLLRTEMQKDFNTLGF